MNEIQSALLRVLPFIMVLIGVSIGVKRKRLRFAELDLKKPESIGRYLVWTFGFLVFILAVEFSLSGLGLLEIDKWNHTFLPSIIRITGAVILAPFAEEIIFRGLILNLLNKKIKNIHAAILIQAVLFVLLHSFTYENTVSSNFGIAQSFIDATLFGYARIHTKSLYTPITMHMTGNLIATLERFI